MVEPRVVLYQNCTILAVLYAQPNQRTRAGSREVLKEQGGHDAAVAFVLKHSLSINEAHLVRAPASVRRHHAVPQRLGRRHDGTPPCTVQTH